MINWQHLSEYTNSESNLVPTFMVSWSLFSIEFDHSCLNHLSVENKSRLHIVRGW